MNEIITVRDLSMVTSDILYAQRQGARQLASNLIEIGRLLVEAKEMVKPGEWEKYIWDNFGYSTSSADNWMKLYREYGNDQESLFDSFTNSQTFGKLSYTQLLALTALPAEERSEFVEKNDVENMSTRQLQQVIKERDEERKKAAAAQFSVDSIQGQLAKALNDKADLETENKRLVDRAKKAEASAKEELKQAGQKLRQAQEAERKAREELEKVKASPEVPESVMEKLRQEAQTTAATQATEAMAKELEEAKKKAASAESALRDAQSKLLDAQKAATMANPEMAVFKNVIQQVREDFNRLNGMYQKIAQADPAAGENLKAVIQQLLDMLWKEVA